MYKIFCFLVLFICFSFSNSAQDAELEIQWGDELKASRFSTLSSVVGQDESGVYTIREKVKGLIGNNSTFLLEKYDQDMHMSSSSELILKDGDQKRELEFVLHSNDRIQMFTSFVDKDKDRKFLYVQEVSKERVARAGDLRTIAEIDFSGKHKSNAGNFDFEFSEDNSKILIYYNKPYDRGASEKFGFHVFDEDLNEIWVKEVSLPYLDELFTVEGYEVSNDGSVYLLGMLFDEKFKMVKRGKPNYKHVILGYTEKGEILKKYPISFTERFLFEMQIAINQDGDIICGGFYGPKSIGAIEGSYFLKINGASKEVVSKSFQAFSFDLITQNMSDRAENRAKKKVEKGKDLNLYSYDLDEIILREDGGAVLVGEQFYVTSSRRTNTNAQGVRTTTTDYRFNYLDILVINMSPDGKIDWSERIHKLQTTQNDFGSFSSYALAVDQNKLHFMFNDHSKNLEYERGDRMYPFVNQKKSIVSLVTLDNQGQQKRQALFSAKEAEVITRPKVCRQISGNEMLLYGQKKKSFRFAKIVFK